MQTELQTMEDLAIGDRFILPGDKKKKVWQVLDIKLEKQQILYNRINAWGYKMYSTDLVGRAGVGINKIV